MKNNILTEPLFFDGTTGKRGKTGKSTVARHQAPCYDGRHQRKRRRQKAGNTAQSGKK